MKRKTFQNTFCYLLVFILLAGCKSISSAQVDKVLKDFQNVVAPEEELTTEHVINGLKEALSQGVSTGSDQASQMDGYLKNSLIKIAFPPDAAKVESRLRQIGLGKEVDKFIVSLNRAAELAAVEAKPIFLDAIRSMTIEDAWAILRGDQHSATRYLKNTTSSQLKEKFQPIIRESLEQVHATRYYDDLVTTYNRIPLVKKVNPDLDEYATEQAIDGLFKLIAKEEANIRENPAARTTDLLRRVFGAEQIN